MVTARLMCSGWLAPVLWLVTSCSLGHHQEPYTAIPVRSSLDIRTIVLTPTSLPERLISLTSAMEEIDSLIAASLDDAGFELIHATEYARLWEGIIERVGGVIDSATGERVAERFEVARQQLFAQLSELYEPDALLYPEIWIVDAPFAKGTAQWDGTSQALIGLGTRLIHALGAAFSGSESSLPTGTVEALSLVVFLEDMGGDELYANSGGIEVLEKVGGDERDRWRVPDDELFTSHARNRRAVAKALDPLLSEISPSLPKSVSLNGLHGLGGTCDATTPWLVSPHSER